MRVVPILVGPTGIGKTGVSIHLAHKIPIEIISADSRQLFRSLNIGTAKPSKDVLKSVPHHFIDFKSPKDYFSAGMYGRMARKVIGQILDSGKTPLVVGGSGFYIRALVDGLSEIRVKDDKLRKKLENQLIQHGVRQLHHELNQIDPDLANTISKTDKQRILRGLEVYYATGNRLSELQATKATPADFTPLQIGLSASREYLYYRVNQRVDAMIADGLVDEVIALRKRGLSTAYNALNTVGYKEVFEYLEGKIDFKNMADEIKKNTRRYAKRQMTWFRADERIRWINVDENSKPDKIADVILAYYMEYKPMD